MEVVCHGISLSWNKFVSGPKRGQSCANSKQKKKKINRENSNMCGTNGKLKKEKKIMNANGVTCVCDYDPPHAQRCVFLILLMAKEG